MPLRRPQQVACSLAVTVLVAGCTSLTEPWRSAAELTAYITPVPSTIGLGDTALLTIVAKNETSDTVRFPSRCLSPSVFIYRAGRPAVSLRPSCFFWPEHDQVFAPGDSIVGWGQMTVTGYPAGLQFERLQPGVYELRAAWEIREQFAFLDGATTLVVR